MTNKLDMSVLRERLEEQRTVVDFYYTSIEMLVKKFEVHKHTDLDRLNKRHPDIDERILAPICLGLVPLRDDINRADIDDLVLFAKDLMVLCGAAIGLAELYESGSASYAEYLHYVIQCKDHNSFWVNYQGFCVVHLFILLHDFLVAYMAFEKRSEAHIML